MEKQTYLHEQRKELNNIYNMIVKKTFLPEQEFDYLMALWVTKNKNLEEKELRFENKFMK